MRLSDEALAELMCDLRDGFQLNRELVRLALDELLRLRDVDREIHEQ